MLNTFSLQTGQSNIGNGHWWLHGYNSPESLVISCFTIETSKKSQLCKLPGCRDFLCETTLPRNSPSWPEFSSQVAKTSHRSQHDAVPAMLTHCQEIGGTNSEMNGRRQVCSVCPSPALPAGLHTHIWCFGQTTAHWDWITTCVESTDRNPTSGCGFSP